VPARHDERHRLHPSGADRFRGLPRQSLRRLLCIAAARQGPVVLATVIKSAIIDRAPVTPAPTKKMPVADAGTRDQEGDELDESNEGVSALSRHDGTNGRGWHSHDPHPC